LARPDRSERRRFGAVIATSSVEVLQRPIESAQYGALAFGQRCKALGVRPSMGSRGDAYDNAMAESFFATLECELLARRRFASHAEARLALFRWIEGWYNRFRRHSALGQRSPVAFERAYTAAQAVPTSTPAAA
jgi:putative transposase